MFFPVLELPKPRIDTSLSRSTLLLCICAEDLLQFFLCILSGATSQLLQSAGRSALLLNMYSAGSAGRSALLLNTHSSIPSHNRGRLLDPGARCIDLLPFTMTGILAHRLLIDPWRPSIFRSLCPSATRILVSIVGEQR
jgi:hypothetical protein